MPGAYRCTIQLFISFNAIRTRRIVVIKLSVGAHETLSGQWVHSRANLGLDSRIVAYSVASPKLPTDDFN